jgi:hypothetical protein
VYGRLHFPRLIGCFAPFAAYTVTFAVSLDPQTQDSFGASFGDGSKMPAQSPSNGNGFDIFTFTGKSSSRQITDLMFTIDSGAALISELDVEVAPAPQGCRLKSRAVAFPSHFPWVLPYDWANHVQIISWILPRVAYRSSVGRNAIVKLTLGGALGFGAVLIIVLLIGAWIATRRILQSPYPSTPASAAKSGWHAVFQIIRFSPLVALAGLGIKLFQTYGEDTANILLRYWPRTWSITGFVIELIFALAWAAFAMRIYLLILAPEATAEETRARTRRAVLYALSFWALTIAITVAGIGLVILVKGADRGNVMRSVGYISKAIIVVAALSRPAIAIGLAKPVREALRILRENWFGAAVTLILAALPFGLVLFGAALLVRFVHMGPGIALMLQLPITALSALCYAAFEGVIAAMYKRIM